MKRNSIVIILTVGVAAAVAIGFAVNKFLGDGSAAEQEMAAARAQPLIGLVLADNPAAEVRLREAIEAGQPLPAVAELRRTVIAPALSAADDATADAVMKARRALAIHLQKTDLAACRQLAGSGIANPDKLDSEGQQLFRAVLTAMEAAYRSGKANGGKGTPPSNEAFSGMLKEAGFMPDDFARFQKLGTLPDSEVCALDLKVEEAPDHLPEDKRGPFARFIITH